VQHPGAACWRHRARTVLSLQPTLILYGLRAGPTVVVDQQHCPATQQEQEDATPRRSLLAYPRENSFLMFDGRLGHGVLDTLSGGTRMTLLINWWHHKPMVSIVWKPAARQQLVNCLMSGASCQV
jgi:hypothetical protein